MDGKKIRIEIVFEHSFEDVDLLVSLENALAAEISQSVQNVFDIGPQDITGIVFINLDPDEEAENEQ